MFRALRKRLPPAPAWQVPACRRRLHGSELQLEHLLTSVDPCTHSREVNTSQEQTRLPLRRSQAPAVGREGKTSKQSRLDLPLQVFCGICIFQLTSFKRTGCSQDRKSKQSSISVDHYNFFQSHWGRVQRSLSISVSLLHPHSPYQLHWHNHFWGSQPFLGLSVKHLGEIIQDGTCLLSMKGHL